MTSNPDPRVAICDKGARHTLDPNDPDFAWCDRVGSRHMERRCQMEEKTVSSTSDARTANNAVRHAYRVLTDQEKALMVEVKDLGAALIALLHRIGGTDPQGERMGSRDLSLAQTHAEDAVMRAVRHITK